MWLLVRNMSQIVRGHKLCLTSYIRIHMSCSLLLYNDGSFAFTNSCWWLDCLSLNTARSPRSCSLSNPQVSKALQKCHTKWQYVKCGRIAAFKRCYLASVGMRFLNLIITAILWLAFLQTLLICKLKFRPPSIVTPRSSKLSDSIISLPLIVILVLSP